MSRQQKENATCIICGKKYHLCISCERNKETWKKWKMITDNENCYNIYNVLNDYNFNKISKNDARMLLDELDLTDVKTFKNSVIQIIEEIMKAEKTDVVKTTEVSKNIESDNNAEVVNYKKLHKKAYNKNKN